MANNAQVDLWDFDPFELERVTQGHPLVTLGAHLFTVKYNFFSRLAFSKVTPAHPEHQRQSPRLTTVYLCRSTIRCYLGHGRASP